LTKREGNVRGRKRTPTAKRIREGNPSGRPLPADEPKPTPATPAFDVAPLELADHPDAVAEWARLAPMLRTAGQVSLVDRAALAAACLEWDRYLAAVRALHAQGLVVTTKSGEMKPNPHVGVAHKAVSVCARLWAELGLTPTSRARLTTTPLSPLDDPFAEFDVPPGVTKPQ
jgi:P27 family predicted phage terminase small subunit